jgi:hypothetical protein
MGEEKLDSSMSASRRLLTLKNSYPSDLFYQVKSELNIG